LKQIQSYGGILSKSLFLMISSGGKKPHESINIKVHDLYLAETQPRIYVNYQHTRTKQSRSIFISSETKRWINQ
jgi:hypothetical protein